MKKSVFAAIDIGSYNCRLTIVKKNSNGYKILHNFSNGTNLIKNLTFNNEFNDQNTKKTIKCLTNFSKKLFDYKVDDYRCIATEACRQVINPYFLVDTVRKKTGLKIEIISSYEEAKLSFKSCTEYIKKIDKIGILFDIGGGSTEFTFFNEKKKLFKTKSISYGVINLSEKNQLFGNKYVFNELKGHFTNIKNEMKKELNENIIAIGSCSTITTLCAIYLNLKSFDSKKIESYELDKSQLLKLIEFINSESNENLRRMPCVGSKYLLLLNGIEILKIMLEAIPLKKVIVTQKGLRDGIMRGFM